MKSLLLLAALATGALAISPALAAPPRRVAPHGITAEQVAQVLQSRGYKAVVGIDDDGDPKVTSATDGTKFTIFFYGCHGARRCESLTFQAGLDLPDGMNVDRINKWNKDKRFLKGWLDSENDPYVEMDVDADHGFTNDSLADYIETWSTMLPTFKSYVGFND